MNSFLLRAFTAAIFVVLPFVTGVNAQALPDATVGNYTSIHSIAVLSGLGGALHLSSGRGIFAKTAERDIRGWKIDDEAQLRVRQYISSKFQITDISYDREALQKLANSNWGAIISDALPDFLKSLPKGKVDAYLLILPWVDFQQIGHRGPSLITGDNNAASTLSLNYRILIIDAQTLKTIGMASSRSRFHENETPSAVSTPLPPRLKINTDFIFTDEQMIGVHGFVSRMLNVSLVETLRDLKLGVSLPPPGFRILIKIPDAQNPYRNTKSIAIISGIGGELDLEQMGTTILTAKSIRLPIAEWNLDNLIETTAKKLLSSQYLIKDVPVDRAAFATSKIDSSSNRTNIELHGVNSSPDVDAYLVFLKSKMNFPPTNYSGEGLGVFNTTNGLLKLPDTRAFASYVVAVVDAKTLKIISRSNATLSPEKPTDTPLEVIDAGAWPKQAPNMSTAQSDKIRSAITELLFDSVPETLLTLGLMGVLPVVGSPLPDSSQSPLVPIKPISFSMTVHP